MARRQETAGAPRPTYAMRLGDDERQVIEAAAAVRGVAMSQYVRTVALTAARRELAGSVEMAEG